MNIEKEEIKALAHTFHKEAISIRRIIHQNPELAFEETKTAALICEKLDSYGIPYQKNIAKTGVVGMIKGKNPDSFVVALRADMDALPIKEANQHTFVSKNEGVMHACGHDVHTTALLITAKILNTFKDRFEGSVKLIFQPSEEQLPGGAQAMIKEGVLENPRPDMIIGQHVYPDLPAGTMGLRPGRYMASTDELYLTVKGKGGHGALPDKNIDPVLIAAHIITAMQQIVSRHANPGMPTVVSFGRFIADGQVNIIPNQVELHGILRTFDEQWRNAARKKITKLATEMATAMGGSCEVKIVKGYPVLINHQGVTRQTKAFAIEYLGQEYVKDLDIRMTAEDFAYYSHEIPACFYRLGTRNEKKEIVSGLHTATFDVDESSLETAPGLMSWIVLNHLKNKSI
jgi:amidohydrolase